MTLRRIVAVIVALYLLLVLIDRFVLVELFMRRVGVPILFAAAVALACIGTGYLVRRLRGDLALNLRFSARSAFSSDSCTSRRGRWSPSWESSAELDC
jgi:hypothetical protein